MPNTVVFLWISAGALGQAVSGSSSPASVPASAARDLRDYGAARGMDFRAPAPSEARPKGSPANDAALVDALEAELEQARTALAALEEGAASARLTRVEGQLLAHPYLPQASFLMGECLALQARAARERSPALAEALNARREELEGPRAAAFGELAAEEAPSARRWLPVNGLADRDVLEVDGARLGDGRRVELGDGLHHVRVLRGGRVVLATFTEVVAEQSALNLEAARVTPCSAEDLRGVEDGSSSHVTCPRWATVRAEGSGIGVSLCVRERCGAFVHWERRKQPPFAPLPVERSATPAWLGFAIAGVTVAAATSLVLWQSGAFERSRPNAARWEYGGINPQSAVRF